MSPARRNDMTKSGTSASKGQDEDGGGKKCALCGDDTSLSVHCLLVMKLEKVHVSIPQLVYR